jgi:inner membrane protein
MDLWTTYGTRVLGPFDGTWYAWDLVFIVDPYVWLTLIGAIAAEWMLRRRGSPVAGQGATVGLALLLSYVGARALLHSRALDEAAKVLPVQGVRRIAALPSPLDPLRWKVLADAEQQLYSGEIDLRHGPRPLERREKRVEDAVVAHVRESSATAALFLDFSRFPWLEVQETAQGWTVSWRDLRFEDVPGLSERRRRREGFVARVVLGPDGRIVSETIRF